MFPNKTFHFNKTKKNLFENQNVVLNQNFSFQILCLYNRKKKEKINVSGSTSFKSV